MGGVADHDGKADVADLMAESMSECEDSCISAVGCAVAGFKVWNFVVEDEEDWTLPL